MPGHHRRRSTVRLLLAAVIGTALLAGSATLPGATASALSRWTGGVDLYRSGVFTTQKTWLWCTAADVQIIRNIVDHATDHTRANQRRYFDYMRAHDRYAIPVSDGTDPGGWTAGLRHYVDDRYRVVASTSFSSALRSAVTNLRRTDRPVAIAVDHGNHGWVLTGFTATADPAATTRFTVTSVRVVGPLWGLKSRTYGYDMKPDKRLTPSQFKAFFTPWHYGRIRMAWEGRWVSIQAIPRSSSPVAAGLGGTSSTAASTGTATSQASSTGSASSMPDAAGNAMAQTSPSAEPPATPAPSLAAVAVAGGHDPGPPGPGVAAEPVSAARSDLSALGLTVAAATLVSVAVVLGGVVLLHRSRSAAPRRSRRSPRPGSARRYL